MLKIGLTNWAKHPDLLDKKTITLTDYAQFYSCVEVDSFFYGVKGPDITQKWHDNVDDKFKFVVKASKEITRQTEASDETVQQQCQNLIESLKPMNNKLAGILLQFPAFFEVNKLNILYLRNLFEYLKTIPLIVEFRHNSWYDDRYFARTIRLLRQYQVTLGMIDEPQGMDNSVPFDVTITNDKLAFFRFHGRNLAGWNASSGFESGARTNYKYSTEELQELAKAVSKVSGQVKQTIVIFNNNGGLDANKNAIEFQKILGLKLKTKFTEQIELL